MSNVNWYLMALSFALGLVLTSFYLIRRVKREVPEYASGGGAARLAGADAEPPTAKVAKVEPDVDLPDVDTRGRSGAGAAAAATAGVAGGAAAAKLVGSGADSDAESEPYGEGSARLTAGASAPSGWTIKGNEDSMLYHTPESPSYKQTIAELWFRDEPTAQRAGFSRWDSGKSQRGVK